MPKGFNDKCCQVSAFIALVFVSFASPCCFTSSPGSNVNQSWRACSRMAHRDVYPVSLAALGVLDVEDCPLDRLLAGCRPVPPGHHLLLEWRL